MMKNKNLLIGLCSVPLLLSISTSMTAQDLRERTYYYEILEPRHEPIWGIERSGFFNGQGKWAKGFENQMV